MNRPHHIHHKDKDTMNNKSSNTPAAPATFPPSFLAILGSQARQAVFEWLKENAPAHVQAVFDGADCLEIFAAHPNDATVAKPNEIDEIVLDTLKGMAAMGVAFGDDLGKWHASLSEVQS